MTGCVGALDGIALRIHRPRPADAGDPNEYFNRKGFYALVIQAMCDHKRRFMFASCTSPGSTHDSRAFKQSQLHQVIIIQSIIIIIPAPLSIELMLILDCISSTINFTIKPLLN